MTFYENEIIFITNNNATAITIENKVKAYVNFKKLTNINKIDTTVVQMKNLPHLKLASGKTNSFTTTIINIKHNKLHNI